MESLPSDPLLEYNDDTFKSLRKQYNFEKKEDMDAAIDVFEEWLTKQNHFTKKEYPRKYLEITLISLKGSVERAKTQMDRLCTLKTILARFFDISDPIVEYRCFKGKFQQALLPRLTKEHHRIYVSRFQCNGLDADFYFKTLKCATAICEYIKLHDYNDGFIAIADFHAINIVSFLSEVNISDLRQMVTLIMEGYQMRVKAIHLVTESTTIDLLVKLFKQLFSQKIGQRIHTHKSIDTLYDYVPREILPSDFGGEEKSLEELFDHTLEVLGSEENMQDLMEMRRATVVEKMRPKGFEDYGMIGTFRSLSVD
ncbi:uncharacterized protein LOC115448099 [Manduca sexta]|uniref:uncharacterized protein LOC115448099 n=1 Tax=Manduca sexta TaxID=7130 RepID=UPI001181CFC3|nr:uncharacterized protein LOC115448099 [Manduca sexta]